eukprot:m.90811 g.90811  ORF g.90811 m.90811 type:complete len:307 (+) comp14604_c2_seq1:361-1281(+)
MLARMYRWAVITEMRMAFISHGSINMFWAEICFPCIALERFSFWIITIKPNARRRVVGVVVNAYIIGTKLLDVIGMVTTRLDCSIILVFNCIFIIKPLHVIVITKCWDIVKIGLRFLVIQLFLSVGCWGVILQIRNDMCTFSLPNNVCLNPAIIAFTAAFCLNNRLLNLSFLPGEAWDVFADQELLIIWKIRALQLGIASTPRPRWEVGDEEVAGLHELLCCELAGFSKVGVGDALLQGVEREEDLLADLCAQVRHAGGGRGKEEEEEEEGEAMIVGIEDELALGILPSGREEEIGVRFSRLPLPM